MFEYVCHVLYIVRSCFTLHVHNSVYVWVDFTIWQLSRCYCTELNEIFWDVVFRDGMDKRERDVYKVNTEIVFMWYWSIVILSFCHFLSISLSLFLYPSTHLFLFVSISFFTMEFRFFYYGIFAVVNPNMIPCLLWCLTTAWCLFGNGIFCDKLSIWFLCFLSILIHRDIDWVPEAFFGYWTKLNSLNIPNTLLSVFVYLCR